MWKLKTPVFLRGNATISCMIPEKDTPGHMAWTKDGKLIGLNNASRNSTKYLLFTIYNKNYMMFSLVIKDIGLEDLNLVYKCESGFSSAEGIIPLNEETFVGKCSNLIKTVTLPSCVYVESNYDNGSNTTNKM